MTVAKHMNEDKRRFLRRAVLWGGKIYSNGRLYDCTIWNISLGGAKVRLTPGLSHGAPVTLSINRLGEFQAYAVWQDDKSMGLQFVLSDDQVESIMGETALKLGLKGVHGKSPLRPGSTGYLRRAPEPDTNGQ